MRIKNDNMNNNVVQPTKKPEPHIPPAPKLKRKLPKNEQQEQTIVNADLFVTLGYHKSFATKLYNFCVSQMMKSDESFTVTELVASRTALGHMTIGSFFKDPKTKSYIHAFDRIFEYHLNDRNMGYKDFSIISN